MFHNNILIQLLTNNTPYALMNINTSKLRRIIMRKVIKFPISKEGAPLPTEEKMRKVLLGDKYSPKEIEEYRQMWQKVGSIEIFPSLKLLKK